MLNRIINEYKFCHFQASIYLFCIYLQLIVSLFEQHYRNSSDMKLVRVSEDDGKEQQQCKKTFSRSQKIRKDIWRLSWTELCTSVFMSTELSNCFVISTKIQRFCCSIELFGHLVAFFATLCVQTQFYMLNVKHMRPCFGSTHAEGKFAYTYGAYGLRLNKHRCF